MHVSECVTVCVCVCLNHLPSYSIIVRITIFRHVHFIISSQFRWLSPHVSAHGSPSFYLIERVTCVGVCVCAPAFIAATVAM